MNPPTPDVLLAHARQILRSEQRRWADELSFPPVAGNYESTLKLLSAWTPEIPLEGRPQGGYTLRLGSFPRDVDRAMHARDITERVKPGPYEVPSYFDMLAFQAAAVEGCLLRTDAVLLRDASPSCSRVLIGTTYEPRSHAYSDLAGKEHAFVLLSGGMMDFLYNVAKAVVSSWVPVESPDKDVGVFSIRPEAVELVMDNSPYPVGLLHDTLMAWLYDGYPGGTATKKYQPLEGHALSLLERLTFGAERFVLAHEYGHVLCDWLNSEDTIQAANTLLAPATHDVSDPAWRRELRADLLGASMLVESGAMYDNWITSDSLAGAVLAMRAHQIWGEAVAAALPEGVSPPKEIATHPPFERRVELLKYLYLDAAATESEVADVMAPSRTLKQIWARALPAMRSQFSRKGWPLHRIWKGYVSVEPS